jgi:hypothetical protein
VLGKRRPRNPASRMNQNLPLRRRTLRISERLHAKQSRSTQAADCTETAQKRKYNCGPARQRPRSRKGNPPPANFNPNSNRKVASARIRIMKMFCVSQDDTRTTLGQLIAIRADGGYHCACALGWRTSIIFPRGIVAKRHHNFFRGSEPVSRHHDSKVSCFTLLRLLLQ